MSIEQKGQIIQGVHQACSDGARQLLACDIVGISPKTLQRWVNFGSTVNGKFATRYTLSDDIALRASLSTGFRAPSLQQQYFTSIATVFVEGVPTETGTFAPSSDVAIALGSPKTKLNLSAV